MDVGKSGVVVVNTAEQGHTRFCGCSGIVAFCWPEGSSVETVSFIPHAPEMEISETRERLLALGSRAEGGQ